MRGLLIGRFQPFHRGHLEVMKHLRASYPDLTLILGIGSSEESYTPENPFTAGERAEMIERALREAKITNWIAVPIPDIDRHALWVAHLKEIVPPFDRVFTNNALTRLLFERDGYLVEPAPMFERDSLQGVKVRTAILDDIPWATLVPEGVARYLEEIGGPARVRLLGPE